MSRQPITVPPGRAGWLWLDRRLGAARRGTDLLDRKLRILQARLTELQQVAAATEREWRQKAAAADRALLIATLLGGQRAVRLAEGTGHADVEIEFAVTMGVRHPLDGTCAPPPGQEGWAGASVEQARQAHQTALAAAVKHAVAARAANLLETETMATRYRLRAIRDRLIPSLEQARAQVVLAIDELERADSTRLRLPGRHPVRQGK